MRPRIKEYIHLREADAGDISLNRVLLRLFRKVSLTYLPIFFWLPADAWAPRPSRALMVAERTRLSARLILQKSYLKNSTQIDQARPCTLTQPTTLKTLHLRESLNPDYQSTRGSLINNYYIAASHIGWMTSRTMTLNANPLKGI